MPIIKLKDRIDSYIDSSNYKLLPKVPIIICVNGRGFNKVTSLLDKPYCEKFEKNMLSTMVKLCVEVEGTIFAYQHNDEIVLITKNDQTQETNPWCDNRVQKISSITSSIATQQFNNFAKSTELDILGDAIFTSHVFAVPNISEAINTIIYKQQSNFYTSIQFACIYELLKKYDKLTIKEMLTDLNMDEKIDLLKQECNIKFDNYPLSFRRGAACYKVPKIIDESVKNKWIVNVDIPIFSRDQSFLSNIFKNGVDIFRNQL
jgi:tRNA(His) 5'-end guanylyltransferase